MQYIFISQAECTRMFRQSQVAHFPSGSGHSLTNSVVGGWKTNPVHREAISIMAPLLNHLPRCTLIRCSTSQVIPIPLALQIYCRCSDKELRQVRSICGVTTKMKKTSQKVRVGAKAFFAMLKSEQMQRFSIHGSWNTYAHYCTMLRRTNVSTSN